MLASFNQTLHPVTTAVKNISLAVRALHSKLTDHGDVAAVIFQKPSLEKQLLDFHRIFLKVH